MMVDSPAELENEDFWSDSVRDIALEFEVPPSTAASWERNIGDTTVLREKLGENGPDNYLNLIRRWEWIPREREKREEEWVEPLKRWCTRRAEDVHLVHKSERENFRSEHSAAGIQKMSIGSGWRAIALIDDSTKRVQDDAVRGINWTEKIATLQEELEQKQEWVKYEMRRVDPDWIGLTRELRMVKKKLIKIYRDYIENDDRQFKYKKDKIIELKRAFPYLRTNTEFVVEATDSSYSYVNQFKYIPEEGVANREVKRKLRDEVLERDNNGCVSCGGEDDLQVHHIIPRHQGGENSEENLATLCADCHYYAHGGGQPTNERRLTTASWDSVEYDNQAEFWDEWIHQSFEERAPKDLTRADFESEE